MGPRKEERIKAIKVAAFQLPAEARPHLQVCYLCEDWVCTFMLMNIDAAGCCDKREESVIKEKRSGRCKEAVQRIRENLISINDIDHVLLITSAEDIQIPEDML